MAAQQIRSIFNSGEALVVNDVKLYASDVSEFMVMGAVLDLSQIGEGDDGRELR